MSTNTTSTTSRVLREIQYTISTVAPDGCFARSNDAKHRLPCLPSENIVDSPKQLSHRDPSRARATSQDIHEKFSNFKAKCKITYHFKLKSIVKEMHEIESYKVSKLPDSAYYIPSFITPKEEADLLERIYSAPKPKWKTLLNRRLQNWGGLPHPKGMIQEELPVWLTKCIKKVCDLGVFGDKTPNHVLVNEYLPGQGIMPHEDGPLFYPTIATVNLGSHTVLDYYEKGDSSENFNSDGAIGSLLLERRSLLLVKEDLYTHFLHGIKERESDTLDSSIKNMDMCDQNIGAEFTRQSRISLTIRHVPQTLKAKFLFGIK